MKVAARHRRRRARRNIRPVYRGVAFGASNIVLLAALAFAVFDTHAVARAHVVRNITRGAEVDVPGYPSPPPLKAHFVDGTHTHELENIKIGWVGVSIR